MNNEKLQNQYSIWNYNIFTTDSDSAAQNILRLLIAKISYMPGSVK